MAHELIPSSGVWAWLLDGHFTAGSTARGICRELGSAAVLSSWLASFPGKTTPLLLAGVAWARVGCQGGRGSMFSV